MIGELFGYIGKKGKMTMIAAIIFETGNALLTAAIMLTILNMLYGVLAEPSQGLTAYFVRFGILLGAKFFCTIVTMMTMHDAGFAMETQLKERVVRRLKEFSLGFYTHEQLGNISTVVHDDVENLQKSISHVGVKMLADIFTAAVIGIALLMLDWRMGLVMMSLLPLSFLFQALGYKKALRLKNENAANLGTMVSRFVEFTRNIPLLKTFRGGLLFQDYVKESAANFEKSSKAEARQGAKDSAKYFLPFELCFALLALAGSLLTVNGNLAVQDFIAFIVFSRVFYTPFANMESYRVTWAQIQSSFGRISKLLQAPVVEKPQAPQRPNTFDIAFKQVGFHYEENGFALHDVDFHLPQGSLTALVGPSGSGKTTVTNLLLRFWEVDSGAIEVGGVDIRRMDYDEWLANVSIVMQNVILFADTIYENIRTGHLDATREQVEEAARKAMIHDFIMGLPDGYDTMLGENGARLSGGEKQRISIARAFLKDAPVLLLDEVTSNVDSLNEVLIQKAISKLSQGRTVLMIAHHLQTIKTAEQILVFKEGVVVERGNHDRLLQQDGVYAKLWQAQAAAQEWSIA
ncbi:ABC transporter ATP-binding protein [Desulfitobacterium chlororespirans]|uniref:ATP-binding cassette, subfamily B n=1 Tax=Desulfitobacterium chlororespirans DSM 11544 TaxID=1121395 RepID=A0A1M7TVT2_9FIRM|nr:ABC transporter ATP-binding protein [Desulfitobacterium chlororespirans]SHN74854.1 ATP-binding cassette, subfamily B [Desulfitobacterium chlororespirans DSM 11544]